MANLTNKDRADPKGESARQKKNKGVIGSSSSSRVIFKVVVRTVGPDVSLLPESATLPGSSLAFSLSLWSNASVSCLLVSFASRLDAWCLASLSLSCRTGTSEVDVGAWRGGAALARFWIQGQTQNLLTVSREVSLVVRAVAGLLKRALELVHESVVKLVKRARATRFRGRGTCALARTLQRRLRRPRGRAWEVPRGQWHRPVRRRCQKIRTWRGRQRRTFGLWAFRYL